MKQLGGALLVALIVLLLPGSVRAAETNKLQTTINITIQDSDINEVRQVIAGNEVRGQKVRVPIIPTSNAQVDVKIGDGSSRQVNVVSEQIERYGLSRTYQTIEIDAPNAKDWAAVITYDNVLVRTKAGEYSALFVDSFINPFKSETINISLDIDSELPASLGLQPQDSIIKEGRQVYEFVSDKPRTKSILLSFGTDVTYRTTQKYELKNSGWWWKDFQIVLPPDSNQQTVGVDSISRTPRSIRVDQDGNIVMTYRIGPKKTVEIEAEVSSRVKSLQYNLPGDLTQASPELGQYTRQIGAWSEGQAVEGESPEDILIGLSDRAITRYEEGQDSESVVNQLIADARATGVPARFMTGSVIGSEVNSSGITTVARDHHWSEVYFDGAGWMTLDPSMVVAYGSVEIIDALHVVQKVHGVSDVEPESEPAMINRIDANSGEINPSSMNIQQTKYMVVPGISVVRTLTRVQGGAVRDNIGYSAGGPIVRLGSLAPFQEISMWSFASGADSWTANELDLGVVEGEEITNSLDSSRASISYLTLLILVIIIALIIYASRKIDSGGESVKVSQPDVIEDTDPEELLANKRMRDPVRIQYD